MFSLLTKKRITEDKTANVFVNSILSLVDEAFPQVANLINEDPEFVISPNIPSNRSDQFLLIVIAGNIKFIPDYFSDYRDIRLIELLYSKFSQAIGVEKDTLKQAVAKQQSLFSKLNHPSKNTHYAMSKAVFHAYDLYDNQKEYFKKMKSPNPIFLKKMDDIISNFIFDWASFLEKYRITQ